MTTRVALFRGINVGKTRSLPMKDLVLILEGLGCERVGTYIQSGNVVYETAPQSIGPDADAISDSVAEVFGFRPQVLLMGMEDLRGAVARNPFPTDPGKFLHFAFMNEPPPAPDLDTLEAIKSETEQFKLDGRVLFLYTPDGFGTSKLAEKIERCLGVPATARNFNTINALLKLDENR